MYFKSAIPLLDKSVLRREYSGVLATTIGFAFVDHFRYFLMFGFPDTIRVLLLVVFVTVAIALVLRALKRNTNVINEESRWKLIFKASKERYLFFYVLTFSLLLYYGR